MNTPIFTMMVGLPGSGKSTYAKEIAKETDAVICSSDAIREELFGDESIQKNGNEVFAILHKRVKEHLRNGRNVIYDACNINSKKRRAFLRELKNIPCIKECVIVATPFDKCCVRNSQRNRVVPYEVIKNMYLNWNTPYWFEGWDKIWIRYTDISCISENDPEQFIRDNMDFDQNNHHHSVTLGKHCFLTAEALSQDASNHDALYYAGLVHDCGKPFTKEFKNMKGEETKEAHYFNHHLCGAYDSLFFQYHQNVKPIDVSILINLHMIPYFWEKDKENGERTKEKYQRLWGDELFGNVMKLHKADRNAH